MATGYEDIDRLTKQQQSMLDKSLKQQNDIVNKQTQMQVDSLERQKADIEKDAINTNKALYQDYRKASNPFGAQAENLAGQGLSNSGYAETTQANLYNTYQKNITSTLNNARDLKADVDFQIQQARQTGDITIAQNALELYKQKMQLLTEEYELRNNREQFLYQKQQDALTQSNWEKEFKYNKSIDKRNFNYQKKQDKLSQRNWEKDYKEGIRQFNLNYALSKKGTASRSRKKSSSKSTSSSINLDDDKTTKSSSTPKKKNGQEYSVQEVLNNVQTIQGAGVKNAIKDGISGKTFKSIDELLNYYGYTGVED